MDLGSSSCKTPSDNSPTAFKTSDETWIIRPPECKNRHVTGSGYTWSERVTVRSQGPRTWVPGPQGSGAPPGDAMWKVVAGGLAVLSALLIGAVMLLLHRLRRMQRMGKWVPSGTEDGDSQFTNPEAFPEAELHEVS